LDNFEYIKSNDIRLRNAIVEVYARKCFYCGRQIDVHMVEIDHIIPSKNSEIVDPKEYHEFLNYYKELECNGFRIDSLINYLPSCGNCNKRKGNKYFTVANLRYFHEYTRKKKGEIIDYIIKKSYVRLSSKERSSNIQYYEANKNNNDYFVDKVVKDIGQFCYYSYGLGQVRIDAHLPVDLKKKINCLILFAENGLNSCMFTFDEEYIENLFFSGYEVGLSDEREFVIAVESNRVLMQFPGNRFYCSKTTAEQLIKIMDDLYKEYHLQIMKLRNTVVGSEFYEKYRGEFTLFRLPKSLWYRLKQFSSSHDYLEGDTRWHIFNRIADPTTIHIMKNHKTNDDSDILVTLKAYDVDSMFVEIVWKAGYYHNAISQMEYFDNDKLWTVRYTYDWLKYDLLPYILYVDECRNLRGIIRRTTFEKFKLVLDYEKYGVEPLMLNDE